MSTKTSRFKKEVIEGLSSNPKVLSSKYFYDKRGNEIFEEIMNLDEYYVTDSEYEVLDKHKGELLRKFSYGYKDSFRLIELGAGDAYKTRVLLKYFIEMFEEFTYSPIDLSTDSIKDLKTNLGVDFPTLKMNEYVLDYFDALDLINKGPIDECKVVLFLGSSIGNLTLAMLKDFLDTLHDKLHHRDFVLFGFDLKKNPYTVLSAYNDHSRVTSDFNLNLLSRINNDLGADFNVNGFYHYPTYDPVSGEAKSYLISKFDQSVSFSGTDVHIDFKRHEPVFMELSKKFDLSEIESIARNSGFEVDKNFFDRQTFYCNSLWKKKLD